VDSHIEKKIAKPLFLIVSFFLISLFSYVSSLGSISERIPQSVVGGQTMGTTYSVVIRQSNIDNDSIKKDIDSILNVINNSMSTYIYNSEISVFNNIEKNTDMAISKHFYNVLDRAHYHYKLSNKKFDPTIGALYDLWGFRGSRVLDEPSKIEVNRAMNLIGMDKIIINTQNSIDSEYSIYKTKDNILIDFSAIAKGYAVDVISEYLMNKGFLNHFVEIGGEIKAMSNSLPWSIGIQNPFRIGESIKQIRVLNKSIATSGNYANYIEYLNTGSIKTHIINPLTGYPLDVKNGLISSATVISNNCIDADALATTLMLLDVDEAMDLIDKLDDSEAFIIYLKDSTLQTRETLGFNEFRD